jgi:hypothetical protein
MEAYKLETTITKDAKIECELPSEIAHLRLKKVDIIIIPQKTPKEILHGAKMLAEQKIKNGWTKKDAIAALWEMKKNINLPIIVENPDEVGEE